MDNYLLVLDSTVVYKKFNFSDGHSNVFSTCTTEISMS